MKNYRAFIRTKMLKPKLALFWLTFLLLTGNVSAAGLPVKLKAVDTPNDKGRSITLTFESLSEDTTEVEYEILRSTLEENSFQTIGKVSSKDTKFVDTSVKDGIEYLYLLKQSQEDDVSFSAVCGPVVSRGQWFNTQRINVLAGVIICFIFIIGFILYGKRGKGLYIRPIAGLQAVDNAIGRATEMGKPILYSSGLGKMDRVATMASMNILSSVAEKTAEYNTPLIFPNYDPVVMATAQEVVFEAYSKAGHP
jgi:hypothetical protein